MPKFRDWDGNVKNCGEDSVIETELKKNAAFRCSACGVPTGGTKATECASCLCCDGIQDAKGMGSVTFDVPDDRETPFIINLLEGEED